MSNFVLSDQSNYSDSYGSINNLSNWSIQRGFFETDLISHGKDIGKIGCCNKGLGDITDVLTGSMGTILLGVGAFVVLMAMGEGNKKKRGELSKAKEEYREKVKQIKGEYGALGYKHYHPR